MVCLLSLPCPYIIHECSKKEHRKNGHGKKGTEKMGTEKKAQMKS